MRVGGKKRRLRIAVVLYGQPRFHHPSLGILRTLRILDRLCEDVQVTGHLWQSARVGSLEPQHSEIIQKAFPHVEVSSPELISHAPQVNQDANLASQATSQRRSFLSSLKRMNRNPDLVLITRTDLWILNLRYLVRSVPSDSEVWNSNFHHSRVDDNIALMTWDSFQKLSDVDFASCLQDPGVLHGEHLRERITTRARLKVSGRFLPYVILRLGKYPIVDLSFAFIRYILRRTLPAGMYSFFTSPKTELARLARGATLGSFRKRG